MYMSMYGQISVLQFLYKIISRKIKLIINAHFLKYILKSFIVALSILTPAYIVQWQEKCKRSFLNMLTLKSSSKPISTEDQILNIS